MYRSLVTGYSSGLGRSISECLLKKKWIVIGVARQRIAQDLIEAYPGQVHHISGSVAAEKTLDEAFAKAREFGGPQLVINSAGQGVFGDVGTYSVADIMSAIEGNLVGLIAFSDRAVDEMRSRGGDIVNVISTSAKKYRPSESVYTAVKWGAKAYTRTLREAMKAQKIDIRVFEVYPCGMQTQFWESAIRPPSDGKAFPHPGPIAEAIISAVTAKEACYCLEIAFERA